MAKKKIRRQDYEDTEVIELTLTFKIKAWKGALLYQGFDKLDDPEQLEELKAQIAHWGVDRAVHERWCRRNQPGAFYPRKEPQEMPPGCY